MYSKYPLKLVSVNLLHEGCWTSYLSDRMEVIAHKTNGRIYRDLVLGDQRGFTVLKKLDVKTRIEEIRNVNYLEGNKVLVDMTLSYHNSIFSILNFHNILLLEPTIVHGNEMWNFLAYEYQVRDVVKELEGVAKIRDVSVEDYHYEKLTENELKTLTTALEMGYYNFPRGASLRDLSMRLKKPKNSVIHDLRSGERKIIRAMLEMLRGGHLREA
ncbi:bacterio-opsin activator [Metallosphaera tengchongensis]|uniref:Bacterio-opsin activator n=1 Tax=Metallosphaera tengchongensis TaxID=1532350 RepID=A0A6N0NVQ1_9CREN|nr:helix-turn-helix domain-containing protein [Metallosphaera tengchongensis]QKR00812.1 bacterio-opsin activator [Metallosphaera tengchongensis]